MMEEEFEKLYREYSRGVFNYAYGRLLNREAAEDVMMEVFAAVWKRIGDAGRGNAAPWIFTIARNFTASYLRMARFRHEVLVDDVPETPVFPIYPEDHPNTLKSAVNVRAQRILSELSDAERDFLEMRYGLGMTNPEIANSLGISEKAVSERYRRLLEKCRQIDTKRRK